jgi:hypothetical protein
MTRDETPVDEQKLAVVRDVLSNAVYNLAMLQQARETVVEYARRALADLEALYVDDEPLDPRRANRGSVDVLDALELERGSLTARGLAAFQARALDELTKATTPHEVDGYAAALALARGYVDTIGANVAALARDLEEDDRVAFQARAWLEE